MTTPTNPIEPFTPFLPSTYNAPEEEDRFKDWIGEKLSQVSDCVNDKKIGVISQAAENFSGGKWFYLKTSVTRNEYQTICYIPSFPNATTTTIGLTGTPLFPIANVNPELIVTLVYGSASKRCSAVGVNDGDYFSFMARGDTRISFTMTDTTLIIVSTVDLSAYSGFIVINYLRNGV
jgi:hypothetical protein